jgi:hypothetical protein
MLNPNFGRVLSAVGACLLIVTLFLVWYHVESAAAEATTTSTGWQAFPRSALPRQTRPVLIARTVLGLAVGGLILRRIIDSPDYVAHHPQPGIYAALLGAVLVVVGGLVDTGRRIIAASPGLGGGRPSPALPPGGSGHGNSGAAVQVPNEAERVR